MTEARALVIEAPAKINLFLRVLHRRPDGYRELETLFQMIDLADRLTLARDPDGTEGLVQLEVDGTQDLGPVESNLAYRAARSFAGAFRVEGSITMRLEKRIPAGAGLGGGSSDAAAVLRLLDALQPGGPGRHEARLAGVAAGLGSDVPFFLSRTPTALGRGRGERLLPIEALPSVPVVVALPPVHVGTAGAYAALAEARSDTGEGAAEARPDAEVAVADWDRVASLAENDFETIVAGRHPEVARSLAALRSAGARFALLSGSGGASFAVFDDAEEAGSAARSLTDELGWPFVATRTRERRPEADSTE